MIFIVDEGRLIASTLSFILKQNGFDVRVFFDGESALQAAIHHRPSLLLSNVAMRVMDGTTLASRIHDVYPSCPMLLLSGFREVCDCSPHQSYHSSWRILERPIDPAILLNTITHIFNVPLEYAA